MNEQRVKALIGIITCFAILCYFSPQRVIASTSQSVFFERFFIHTNDSEQLATFPMITFNDTHYISLRDLAASLHYRIAYDEETIFLSEQKNRPKKTEKPIYSLPLETRERVRPFHETIAAKAGLVMNVNDNVVLFEKNSEKTFYPASTTKLMTALLAIEHGSLDEEVVVSSDSATIPYDSSKCFIRPGDRLTLRQLLYGLLLPSGNDAASAIAVHIGGDQETFVDMMNKRAKELGAANTHFINPHGYHDTNHYTTAQDLANIAIEFYKQDELKRIIQTPIYQAVYKNKNGQIITKTWKSTNRFLRKKGGYKLAGFSGGKTGYTSDAGHALVTFFTKEHSNYISITLKGKSRSNYLDTKKLLTKAHHHLSDYNQTYKRTISITRPLRSLVINGVTHQIKDHMFSYDETTYLSIDKVSELFPSFHVTERENKVVLNHSIVTFQHLEPKIVNNRLFVPVRPLFQQFDLQPSWNAESSMITGSNQDYEIKLPINEMTAYVNGEAFALQATTRFINGHTYVPVRFFSELFNTPVSFGRGRTVVLKPTN